MDSARLFSFNQAGGVPVQFAGILNDFASVERFFCVIPAQVGHAFGTSWF